jgi:hypothetical protein
MERNVGKTDYILHYYNVVDTSGHYKNNLIK